MMQLEGVDWSKLVASILGPTDRVFPAYLVATVLLCAGIHGYRRVSGSFLGWLAPRAIYFHASHILDAKLFILNRVIRLLGAFNLVAVGALVASGLASHVSLGAQIAPFHPFVITALLLLVADFTTYWVHRLHHENTIIWPFHALHHSAEVMTPITLYRKHPVYDVLSTLAKGVLIGALQGAFLIAFDQRPSVLMIAGANVFYVAFNTLGANLRHSHIWLSFGSRLEHLFISPAQHQIHHSTAPEHHDKNYGEVLAIWDWMFGTLYVPKGEEAIEFGLADREGRPLPQRHTSLATALWVPVIDSWGAITAQWSATKAPPACNEASGQERADQA